MLLRYEVAARRLGRLGYRVTRQTGRHIRLICDQTQSHHVTIPNHYPLRVGRLTAIIADVAARHYLERDELIRTLFRVFQKQFDTRGGFWLGFAYHFGQGWLRQRVATDHLIQSARG